jgi:hypothetical protein
MRLDLNLMPVKRKGSMSASDDETVFKQEAQRRFGKVDVPREAFIAALKADVWVDDIRVARASSSFLRRDARTFLHREDKMQK